MASLLLLLEALVRCRKDDTLPRPEKKGRNFKTTEQSITSTQQSSTEQQAHVSSFGSRGEDVRTWKLAKFCNWP
ncbi:hypothetical protein MANES_05G012304v8 [Manihot esculenta]|uniref:Uncharacterized protein n=1 Tax=Manihot esculenta TaxID=3983 RepID=A0ACB7HN19_MANES|nr:hypothetical protein MANES_05G012304v8 [Manihot esculenta]